MNTPQREGSNTKRCKPKGFSACRYGGQSPEIQKAKVNRISKNSHCREDGEMQKFFHKEENKMKRQMKKGFAIVLALVMVFAMTATAFADTTGTCSVKFYVPEKYADLTGSYHTLGHSGYSVYGQKEDVITGEDVNVYEYAGTVTLATMAHPAVGLPTGFQGLYNTTGNAFDVIYNLAVTQKGEVAALYGSTEAAAAHFVYGFDTPSYTTTSVRADGIFINKLSDNSTVTLDSSYGDVGESYWLGYSWSFYVVPSSAVATFNPLSPDDTYKSDMYTNNVNAGDGYTYYMIYEYNEQAW